MILIQRIEEEFTKENIIRDLASYEIYYQISLGYLIAKSEFDINSTYEKIEKLALDIKPENVLFTIINSIKKNYKNENFRHYFNKDLQKEASITALNDYISHDKDLIHPEFFAEDMMEKITTDKFFTADMQKRFVNVYDDEIKRWKDIITDEFIEAIKTNALQSI